MRHYFMWNGKSSMEFNTFIAQSNMFDAPERDIESVAVPGRNGELTFDNGRFHNFHGTVSAYIPRGMQSNADGLRSFLLSDQSYCRYEDTIHPDEFRLARFTGPFEIEESDRVGASFVLEFDCKPQRFLKSGEAWTAYSSGSVLRNPTEYEAMPIIRASGNGSITLNGKTITISGNSGVIYIDCDLQDAYNGSTNKNAYITPVFPTLSPGNNTLTYSGVTGVQIMPRWWKI